MNANELAEIQAFKTEELTMWERNHTATMLRQQQEQINNLKQWEKRQLDLIETQQVEIEALKQIIDANNLNQNIGQFVKPTNEPVAWMHQNPEYPISKHWSQEYNIPLYTHSAKTITDEEIWRITEDFWKRDWTTLDVGFARAILRKAQEK